MQHKRLKLSVVLLFGLELTGIHAQTSVNATGGNASGNGGTISYSVGQVTYQTHTGTNGSVAECVQQPYEISIITGLEEAQGIILSFSAYPNPATDFLTLSIDASTTLSINSMSYKLYDMNGKFLQSEKITGKQTNIVMSNLVPATYFVKVILNTQVIANQQEIKTFKIIKN
jgi:hypothetical protein